MNTFDPATVRQAVAEFIPLRPRKFQDLIPAKDVIAELRQRRASYCSIAELLTQHCLATSKSAIAAFCHQVLGENVRPRKRPARRRSATPTPAAETPATPEIPATAEEPSPVRPRGPRIAQIRKLIPPNETIDSHP